MSASYFTGLGGELILEITLGAEIKDLLQRKIVKKSAFGYSDLMILP